MLEKNCKYCNKVFQKPYNVSRASWFGNKRRPNGVQYCSKKCASTGKKHSEERKQKVSEGLKKSYQNNERSGFMIGMTPWNKGTIGKMNIWNKGVPCSEETKSKISQSLTGRYLGKDNPSWRGGLTEEGKRIRNSAEYTRWRKIIFERDNYTCQECGEVGGNLNAHHVKSFSTHIDCRFTLDNGLTLCKKCHKETDNYGNKCLQKDSYGKFKQTDVITT